MLPPEEYRSFIYRLLDSARADRDVQTNIQRGLSALDKVLKTRSTVHRAMHREGLGWVDFEWGDEGKWPPNARGGRSGEKGVAHVLEARPRKDQMADAQVRALLRKMVYAVAQGTELRRPAAAGVERVVIGKDGTEVHLIKSKGSNAWMMTVFEQWK